MDVSDHDQGGHGGGVAWMRRAASKMRIMERDYLVRHPESRSCPLCDEAQANPGICPTCRHIIMEAYRLRDD